jgi:hypothetical protein
LFDGMANMIHYPRLAVQVKFRSNSGVTRMKATTLGFSLAFCQRLLMAEADVQSNPLTGNAQALSAGKTLFSATYAVCDRGPIPRQRQSQQGRAVNGYTPVSLEPKKLSLTSLHPPNLGIFR